MSECRWSKFCWETVVVVIGYIHAVGFYDCSNDSHITEILQTEVSVPGSQTAQICEVVTALTVQSGHSWLRQMHPS